MNHFLMVGSQPRLSLAEARAVLGGAAPVLVGSVALLAREVWDGAWLQERLAGTTKLGDELFCCALKELTAERIVDALPEREGSSKLTFALTVIGVPKSAVQRLPLEVKKALKKFDRSVRWFADEQGEVSPAAVAKLGLTTEGYDIVIAVERGMAHVCLTMHVQDADAWSLRDYGRPARDSKNGMLPPKLARMMINLGIDTQHTGKENRFTILDPFCGSGTVVMEAVLMEQGAKIIGSDVEAKQVADTNTNLDWMVARRLISEARRKEIHCFPHDAREINGFIHEPVELVVTEGYLGTPLRGHEPLSYLEREVKTIEALWRETLGALAKIQPSGACVVGIWPMLETSHGKAAVDLSEELGELGYAMIDALGDWDHKKDPLVYGRADQFVKRRIVVLKKI